MGIVLEKLVSIGPDLPDAEVVFDPKRKLIRGASDTGKSYIRDCLWYLLGGDKIPKFFPLAEGYQELRLRFFSGEDEYEVRRSLKGGSAAIYCRPKGMAEDAFEPVNKEVSELLVGLSGASGKQILRSKNERGPVTGDDLRHWSLLSQTAVMSEEPTAGADYTSIPRRVASFNLFLSGNDDAAVQLGKKSSEVQRINGQLTSAEDALKRVRAGIAPETTRVDVNDALTRVGEVLSAMAHQYDARAAKLRHVRKGIAEMGALSSERTAQRNQSYSMIGRFQILEQKYTNDLERLGATNEGAAFFHELSEVACPLCGTSSFAHNHPDIKLQKPESYRAAIAAEADKISKLKAGLMTALGRETSRFNTFQEEVSGLQDALLQLEEQEKAIVSAARIEFSADPKTLAERHSELSAQLAIFDEVERLTLEIERLKKLKVQPKVSIIREGGTAARLVADKAKDLLEKWGFTDIQNVALDAGQCDLLLNDRPRLSYGAGKRALYLSAMTISLMEHALENGYPHLGAVVIDSPLKAYADPSANELKDVPLTTVRDKFYDWLAKWKGLGQIVILENEAIHPDVAKALGALEFVGPNGEGRAGFYPLREKNPSPADNESVDENADSPPDDNSDLL